MHAIIPLNWIAIVSFRSIIVYYFRASFSKIHHFEIFCDMPCVYTENHRITNEHSNTSASDNSIGFYRNHIE